MPNINKKKVNNNSINNINIKNCYHSIDVIYFFKKMFTFNFGPKNIDKRKRNLGSLIFIDVRDITGIIQVVIKKNLTSKINKEFVVQVNGILSIKETNNNEKQFEIISEKINGFYLFWCHIY